MSELTLTVLRLGFLVLLWIFVLSVVAVLRRDLFGGRGGGRGTGRRPRAEAPARAEPARSAPPPPARSAPAAPAPAPTAPPAPAPPPETREPQPPRRLVVADGPGRGRAVDLGDAPVLIGRGAECTLVLTDDYASSRHARLFRDGQGRWNVEDLGSTNGTALGAGQKVTSAVPVELGSRLRIGRTVLELRR